MQGEIIRKNNSRELITSLVIMSLKIRDERGKIYEFDM